MDKEQLLRWLSLARMALDAAARAGDQLEGENATPATEYVSKQVAICHEKLDVLTQLLQNEALQLLLRTG